MGAIGLQRVTDSVKAMALYKALGSSVYLKKELFNKRYGPGYLQYYIFVDGLGQKMPPS